MWNMLYFAPRPLPQERTTLIVTLIKEQRGDEHEMAGSGKLAIGELHHLHLSTTETEKTQERNREKTCVCDLVHTPL